MPQIIVENLVKTYAVTERDPNALRGLLRPRRRLVTALGGVSFALDAGDLVGYIGPNGAGKSTTVKILSGILVPDSGHCTVLERVPWKQRTRHVARIGVVFGQRTQLWWDLPVTDSFELLRAIYRIAPTDFQQTRDELIQRLDLEALLDVPVRQLSLGQRMRCDIAASLLHRPDILFLDEPTIGLDAVSKLAVRDFLKRLNQERDVTIILTTHDMDDIEALCRRVIVIGDGQILVDGSLESLRAQVTSERWLIVDFAQPPAEIEAAPAHTIARTGNRVTLSFDPKVISTADLIAQITARYPVRDLFVQDPPIEEIIARFYGSGATG